MTLTKKQRELRKSHLGASDIPALFGEHLKLSGIDIWMSKVYNIAELDKIIEAIEIGNDFEKPLVTWAAKQLGVEMEINEDELFGICKEHPVLSATLDYPVFRGENNERESIEGKTTSLDNADDGKGSDNEWGEPGTDQVPKRVILQCQAQCLVHDLQRVHVPVLMGRGRLRRELYKVERNEVVVRAIIKKAEYFWNTYVETATMPPMDEFGIGDLDLIARVERKPQTWAEPISDTLVDKWLKIKKAARVLEKKEKLAKAAVLTMLGNAEGAEITDGRLLTYFEQSRETVDTARLKQEKRNIYNKYSATTTYRVPRIKKGDG